MCSSGNRPIRWVARAAIGAGYLCASAPAAGQSAPSTPAEPPSEEVFTSVTTARAERDTRDTVVPVDVIGSRDIESSGARDLAELLEENAGVWVESSFRGESASFRGLGPEYSLVLVDDERAIGRTGGAFDLSRIRLEDVERVEIVRGPSSALYGSDAIGGVIHVITRRARTPFSVRAEVSGSTDTSLDASARLGIAQRRWDLSLSAGARRRDATDLDESDVATTFDSRGEVEGSARLAWSPLRTFSIDSRIAASRAETSAIDRTDTGAVFDREGSTETLTISTGPEWRLPGGGSIAARAHYALFRDQLFQDQRLSDALDQYQETWEHGGRLSVRADVPWREDHRTTAGIEANWEHLETPRLQEGSADRQRGALYLAHEWTLTREPRLLLSPGARLDVDSQFGWNVAPKLAVRLDPTDWLALRASYGWGFRAPSFQELHLSFSNPGVGYVVEGNPELRPERSRGLEVSAEVRAGDRVTTSLGFFRNDLDDLIATDLIRQETGFTRFGYVNVSTAYTQGIEASVRVSPIRRMTASVGYTLTDSEDEATRLPLEGRPMHRLSVAARWNAPFGTGFVVRAQVVGERPRYEDEDGDGDDETSQLDPYAAIDLRVTQDIGTHVVLSVALDNLLDAQDVLYSIRPRALRAGAMVRF